MQEHPTSERPDVQLATAGKQRPVRNRAEVRRLGKAMGLIPGFAYPSAAAARKAPASVLTHVRLHVDGLDYGRLPIAALNRMAAEHLAAQDGAVA